MGDAAPHPRVYALCSHHQQASAHAVERIIVSDANRRQHSEAGH
jgi:hypothetical protein